MRYWVPISAVAGMILAGPALAQSADNSAAAGANMKMSKAECQSVWQKADSSGAGSLSQSQAQAYIKDFAGADTNQDGKLSSAEFNAACDKGLVQGSASTGAGAGASGPADNPSSSGSSSSGGASDSSK